MWVCRKSQDGARELKLLLDMYKSAPKEQRDKVQVRPTARVHGDGGHHFWLMTVMMMALTFG